MKFSIKTLFMLAVALAACLLFASAEEGPKELSTAAHPALSVDTHKVDQLGEAVDAAAQAVAK